MRVAGVREKSDQSFVELHALRLLGTVGGNRALRALRGDRARTVREQQADQGLKREQLRRLRRRSEQGDIRHFSKRALSENLGGRDAAKALGLVLLGVDRCPDQRAEQPQPCRQALGSQPRNSLAH